MAKEKKGGKGAAEFSRRDFLKTGAAGALSSGVIAGGVAQAASQAAGGTETVGPGAVPISLSINGQTHRLEVEPRVTLLDALRNQLDITSAKRVCDRATCGACTVLMGGKPVYACSVLAIEAQGQEIRTVESIGTPEQLHPVQSAFVEHDATQCGFCTPGFVVACKALLDEHPNPDREQIRLALGGNLCRCGTYAGIEKAIAALAKGGTNNG